MEEKILEVANVLMGISLPIGMYDQAGRKIRMCADRLAEIAEEEKKAGSEQAEETESEPEAE